MTVNKALIFLFAIITGWSQFVPDNPDLLRCSDNDVIYTVKAGDNLYTISAQFGSYMFWESVYVANADHVSDPDLIYPGQKIRIPYNVASYKEKNLSLSRVLENPFCKVSDLPYAQVQDHFITRYDLAFLESRANAERDQEREKKNNDEGETLEAFRNAFDVVIADSNDAGREENRDKNTQRESERQLMIEIDGMVHDETRSKVGRDFYDVFYSYWQSPPEARNFSIRVSEQPSPNLGTTIFVTVNQAETFRMRLQPRYEMIQEAGKYAVRQTYSHLQNNTQKNLIY